MILVIPAIELRNGQSVQLIKGEEGTESLYSGMSQNPLELSKLWRRENAKTIHINDMDTFDRNANQLNINSILYISQSVDIPIQVYSHFRSVDQCRFYLQNGVYRVVIDELLYIDPDGVRQLIKEFTPYRIIFNFATNNGSVDFRQLKHAVPNDSYLNAIKDTGGVRIIYMDESWMNPLTSHDYANPVRLSKEYGLKVTINGGIGSATQLLDLKNIIGSGIDSVIIGDALYLNCFPCQKIWRLIEAELEPVIKYNN